MKFTGFFWFNIFLFVAALIAVNLLTKDSHASKFVAGVCVSQFAMAGKLIVIEFYRFSRGTGLVLGKLEPHRLTRSFIIHGSVLIMFFSVLFWDASWTGETGRFFGLGVLSGSIIFDLGLGRSFAEYLERYR